jgi:uncharacterized membrane protein SirB2
MFPIYLLIHLIGYGLLISVLVATPVLEYYLRRAENYEHALKLANIVSRIGLLSPAAALILLISGILMMTLWGYTIFSHGWLTGKLLIFLIMVVTGAYSSMNVGKQRREIYHALIDGKDDPKLPGELLRVHNRQSQYTRIQSIFLLMILFLTVYKI